MSRAPSLAEIIRIALDARMAEVKVSLPGRVVRYDASLRQADVQPLIKTAYRDEDDRQVVERLPVITNVPVAFPGASGYWVTFPVAVGDLCTLLFSSASLDKWLSEGGEVDPLDYGGGGLQDAIAFVGLQDFKTPTAAATDCMVVGRVGTDIVVELDETEIRAGGSGAVALATKADLEAVRTALHLHTHLCSSSGNPSGAGPSVPSPSGTTVLKGK